MQCSPPSSTVGSAYLLDSQDGGLRDELAVDHDAHQRGGELCDVVAHPRRRGEAVALAELVLRPTQALFIPLPEDVSRSGPKLTIPTQPTNRLRPCAESVVRLYSACIGAQKPSPRANTPGAALALLLTFARSVKLPVPNRAKGWPWYVVLMLGTLR